MSGCIVYYQRFGRWIGLGLKLEQQSGQFGRREETKQTEESVGKKRCARPPPAHAP